MDARINGTADRVTAATVATKTTKATPKTKLRPRKGADARREELLELCVRVGLASALCESADAGTTVGELQDALAECAREYVRATYGV